MYAEIIKEENYRVAAGQNSTALAKFLKGADYALMPTIDKPEFQDGHVFEMMVCDKATGADTFSTKFFVDETVIGECPQDVFAWVKEARNPSAKIITTCKHLLECKINEEMPAIGINNDMISVIIGDSVDDNLWMTNEEYEICDTVAVEAAMGGITDTNECDYEELWYWAVLVDKYVYNKTKVTKKDPNPAPVLNAKYKSKHSYLDAYLKTENRGKKIVSKAKYEQMEIMVDNFLKMEIEEKSSTSFNLSRMTMQEILASENSLFQFGIVWEKEGIRKKALIDVLYYNPKNMTLYVFDIKTSANEQRMRSSINERNWVQDIHYLEGINTLIETNGWVFLDEFQVKHIYRQMIFIATYKEEPWVASVWLADPEGVQEREKAYNRLSYEYHKWDKKTGLGYIPKTQYSRVWLNQ